MCLWHYVCPCRGTLAANGIYLSLSSARSLWSLDLEKISWKDKVTNVSALEKVDEERSMLNTIRQQKRRWLGQVLRNEVLLPRYYWREHGGQSILWKHGCRSWEDGGTSPPRIWSRGGLSPQILWCCKILSTRLLALQCRKMCFLPLEQDL